MVFLLPANRPSTSNAIYFPIETVVVVWFVAAARIVRRKIVLSSIDCGSSYSIMMVCWFHFVDHHSADDPHQLHFLPEPRPLAPC